MILAIFDLPYPHVRVRKIFQTPPPNSYVRFHFVFRHNKILLERISYTKTANPDTFFTFQTQIKYGPLYCLDNLF
jgi:hypothetical protein